MRNYNLLYMKTIKINKSNKYNQKVINITKIGKNNQNVSKQIKTYQIV